MANSSTQHLFTQTSPWKGISTGIGRRRRFLERLPPRLHAPDHKSFSCPGTGRTRYAWQEFTGIHVIGGTACSREIGF